MRVDTASSAGVIGLSSALELQEAGHAVTIVARDFPATFGLIDAKSQINFTSPWGGAHNRWVPPAGREEDARDHRLALTTYKRMKALAEASPEAGVTFMKGIEFLEEPGREYVAFVKESGEGSAGDLGVEGFRVLGAEELPDARVKIGFEYDTWCVNPMVYCSFLLNRFVYRGGKVVKRDIRDPREVFEMSDVGAASTVVNASGHGFGDEKVFITRGIPTVSKSPICIVELDAGETDLGEQDKRASSPTPATQPSRDKTRTGPGPFACLGTLKAELS